MVETDREKLFAESKQEAERQLHEELTPVPKKRKSKIKVQDWKDDLFDWLLEVL